MVTQEHLNSYVDALDAHDWTFEHSDDPRVWRRGNASLAALEQAQQLIDPDYRIWNQHAPQEFWRTPPATPASNEREGS